MENKGDYAVGQVMKGKGTSADYIEQDNTKKKFEVGSGENQELNPIVEKQFRSSSNEQFKHTLDDELESTTIPRTRRRSNNKSVLQSAIARKEKSFGSYEKHRNKKNQVKRRILPNDKKVELMERQSLVKRHTSTKRTELCSKETTVLVTRSFDDSSDILAKKILSSGSNNLSRTLATYDDAAIKAQLISQLCKCTEDKQLHVECESDSKFCTAIDDINEKFIGCSRLVDVKTVSVLRASARIPFGVFCESHRGRLIRHNCCSACGVFCTEGKFVECSSKHNFHKHCHLSLNGKMCCPHCGDSSSFSDIVITMHCLKKPIILPVQSSHR